MTDSIFRLQTWKEVNDRVFHDPKAKETTKQVPTKVPDKVLKEKLQITSGTDCSSKRAPPTTARKRKVDHQQEICSTSKGAPLPTRRKETGSKLGRSNTLDQEATEQHQEIDMLIQQIITKTNALPNINQRAGIDCTDEEQD